VAFSDNQLIVNAPLLFHARTRLIHKNIAGSAQTGGTGQRRRGNRSAGLSMRIHALREFVTGRKPPSDIFVWI
jgi:hypothetical protein